MQLRFTTYVIGGYVPGQVAEFAHEQAAEFIRQGVAVPVEQSKKLETATQPRPQVETAVEKVAATPPTPPAPVAPTPEPVIIITAQS